MITLIVLLIFLALILVALVFMINGLYSAAKIRIPYVPTPNWAVTWLELHLSLPPGSIVYDLGCGDARVLAGLASRNPLVSFTGIEVQWWPYVLATRRAGKIKNLKIERVDFWQRSIADANYVFCYLFQPILESMKKKLESELRLGSTVISFGFHIPGWTPDQEVSDPSGKTKSRILIYRR